VRGHQGASRAMKMIDLRKQKPNEYMNLQSYRMDKSTKVCIMHVPMGALAVTEIQLITSLNFLLFLRQVLNLDLSNRLQILNLGFYSNEAFRM
jgi:hypothetical protein